MRLDLHHGSEPARHPLPESQELAFLSRFEEHGWHWSCGHGLGQRCFSFDKNLVRLRGLGIQVIALDFPNVCTVGGVEFPSGR